MLLRRRPLVSIVIPSYNHEAFVRTAVNSVLRQSIESIEVIVVDDGSTDNTAKIVEKLNDSRIRLIKLSHNRQIHPRNLALKFARGKYIAFQNSDDVWLKNKLERQVEQFKTNERLSACFTGVKIIAENGTALRQSWASNLFTTNNMTSHKWLRRFFDHGNCLCISSAMVSSKALKKAGLFDESLIQLSDLDLWVRLAAIGDFYIIDKCLTEMRIVGGKNVSTPTPATARRSAMEFAQVLDRFTSRNMVEVAEVFPDLPIKADYSRVIKQAYMARYAWHKSPAHRLYADRLFAGLVSNPNRRREITEHFGAEIFLEFMQKRSELEVLVHD